MPRASLETHRHPWTNPVRIRLRPSRTETQSMVAQLFFSCLLAGILLYAWTEYPRSPVIALCTMLAASGGLYFVWFPEHATFLAEALGIGRGVDLIIYVWVVISLLVLFNLHL